MIKIKDTWNRIRKQKAIKRINSFLYSNWFILFAALFTIIGNVFAIELYVYTFFTLIALYVSLFGDDYLPYAPMIVFCFIMPNYKNNPGNSEQSVFYSGHGGGWVMALAVAIVVFLLFRMCIDDELGFKHLFKTKHAFFWGMIALGCAYLVSGIGSDYYEKYWAKNIVIALLEFAAMAVPYFLLLAAIRWEKVDKKYFAYIGVAMGLIVGVELLYVFFANDVIVDDKINRLRIYAGWGINNNMGAIVSMSVPCAFYFVYKGVKPILYNGVAILLCLFSVLTCSRGSILASAAAYLFCLVLIFIFSSSKKGKVIVTCSALALAVACVALLGTKFNGLAAAFANGFVSEGRLKLYSLGLQFFKGDPVFGTTFFSLSEYSLDKNVNWIWSIVGDFKSFFPGRWHNTIVQILASCGIVGAAGYAFHRLQTIILFAKNITAEKLFIGLSIVVLLGMSLIDCHFFNLGPTLIYSIALAFAEGHDRVQSNPLPKELTK